MACKQHNITNMKRLIYILLSAFVFTACGGDDNYTKPDTDPTPSDWNGDWNDKNDPNYKSGGYNPIEGEWEAYSLNGKEYTESFFLKFSSDLNMWKSSIKPAEGKDPIFDDAAKYIINDKAFKVGKENYYRYNLKNNALTIFISPNTWIFKPYVYKEWRWEGDWNDPKDSHYAQYQGKYNPIKGVWQTTHVDGEPTTSHLRQTFDDSFKWNSDLKITTYFINSTGIKRLDDNKTYKYIIKGNILTLQQMLPKQGIIMSYERVQ